MWGFLHLNLSQARHMPEKYLTYDNYIISGGVSKRDGLKTGSRSLSFEYRDICGLEWIGLKWIVGKGCKLAQNPHSLVQREHKGANIF